MHALDYVAEVGVPGPQVDFLVLAEALEEVVPLAGGAGLVLPHAVEDAKDGEGARNDFAREVDRVADGVPGPVGRDVGPSAKLVRRE